MTAASAWRLSLGQAGGLVGGEGTRCGAGRCRTLLRAQTGAR